MNRRGFLGWLGTAAVAAPVAVKAAPDIYAEVADAIFKAAPTSARNFATPVGRVSYPYIAEVMRDGAAKYGTKIWLKPGQVIRYSVGNGTAGGSNAKPAI